MLLCLSCHMLTMYVDIRNITEFLYFFPRLGVSKKDNFINWGLLILQNFCNNPLSQSIISTFFSHWKTKWILDSSCSQWSHLELAILCMSFNLFFVGRISCKYLYKTSLSLTITKTDERFFQIKAQLYNTWVSIVEVSEVWWTSEIVKLISIFCNHLYIKKKNNGSNKNNGIKNIKLWKIVKG